MGCSRRGSIWNWRCGSPCGAPSRNGIGCSPTIPERLADWWEDYLAELTDVAYRTMLGFGMRGSFLDVELTLHQAFRAMIETKTWKS